jgi:hypothetical protein
LKIINNMPETNIPDYSELSVPENFNPFDEPVIQREYTKPKVSYDPKSIQEIPEPLYLQPNLDELQEDDYEDEKPKSKSKPKASKPKSGFGSDDPFVNNELEDYSQKDSDESASLMVDTFLDGYKAAHTLGQKQFTLSEEDIVKKAIKGELNPDMRIPISQTQTISVHEFIGDFNRQVTEVLVVEDEFIERVRPVMIRVFSSRGYGLTDEQFLMVAFGKDILTKGVQLYAFKKSFTQALKTMTEMYNGQVQPQFNQDTPPPTASARPTPPPPPPPTEPTPPPTPEPTPPPFPPQQETVEQEMIPQEEVTMHEDMEDEISISPVKKRRGRPKKKIRLEPTEEESKTTIIDVNEVDLNTGFDMDDAMETEEK